MRRGALTRRFPQASCPGTMIGRQTQSPCSDWLLTVCALSISSHFYRVKSRQSTALSKLDTVAAQKWTKSACRPSPGESPRCSSNKIRLLLPPCPPCPWRHSFVSTKWLRGVAGSVIWREAVAATRKAGAKFSFPYRVQSLRLWFGLPRLWPRPSLVRFTLQSSVPCSIFFF